MDIPKGISTDFTEFRNLLETDHILWLLDNDGLHVSEARHTDHGYEIVRNAGSPVAPSTSPDGNKPAYDDRYAMYVVSRRNLDDAMKEIEADHVGWTEDRTRFESTTPYSWDVDDYNDLYRRKRVRRRP
jgi:hypothetical protein